MKAAEMDIYTNDCTKRKSEEGSIFLQCLNFSGTEEAALKHKTLCSRKVSKMPPAQNNTLEFTQVHHQVHIPFVVYADFESILETKNLEAK
ncbi:uncharacterized protein LOC127011803 isoform X2 [Drosophila biarmipes]|uniref:uncharacterized protein LOC127011803 isoform X2 n=1 Tax=Drosophila biarmipes TaxID=125945 RepID=UPI0021CCDD43|nr:uncharacterized protein LOC127011803 isoform X2 [Drosophila biarmipes]